MKVSGKAKGKQPAGADAASRRRTSGIASRTARLLKANWGAQSVATLVVDAQTAAILATDLVGHERVGLQPGEAEAVLVVNCDSR